MQYLTRNMSERYLIKNRTNSPDIDSPILVCMQRLNNSMLSMVFDTHSYTINNNTRRPVTEHCAQRSDDAPRLNYHLYERRTTAGRTGP